MRQDGRLTPSVHRLGHDPSDVTDEYQQRHC
jgi:hypothetical protein